MANVDVGKFSILGNSDCSGPSERSEDVDSVGDSAFFGWELVVRLDVSHNLGEPSKLKTWHGCVNLKS